MDASSLPVCLVTLKGEGLSETQLKDLAQNVVRNQLAGVPGAAVPQPFGGRWRQMMLYVDPVQAGIAPDEPDGRGALHQRVQCGAARGRRADRPLRLRRSTPTARSTTFETSTIVPIKLVGNTPVRVSDIGEVKDAYSLQYNAVRVDGQRSVYLPVLKQGGGANTIQVVDGVREKLTKLFDTPPSLVSRVVFDQSQFVKTAISTLLHEGGIGLFLTCLMILIFLGSMRATVAVFFSIPISALATLIALQMGGSSHQQHGAGRAGAGVLAPDRQLGRGAGKYPPPPGTGRAARWWPRRRAGRKWRCRCWRRR